MRKTKNTDVDYYSTNNILIIYYYRLLQYQSYTTINHTCMQAKHIPAIEKYMCIP